MLVHSRILAVDDNPRNLAIIEEALEGRFSLRMARDGEEALRVARAFDPDVVLLDVMMPGPDGFEVCTRLKNDRALRHSQVIMVSARTTLDDRLRGYQAGADDYVTKPFNEEELLAKVCVGLKVGSGLHELRQQIDELCGAAGTTLELVAQLRDAETGEHLNRIRTYSRLLAEELQLSALPGGFDRQFLDDLERASALHDVGKVAIPDSILRKPGPLTDRERLQMQQHTVLGEEILLQMAKVEPDAALFHLAAEIARWHHENLDGSGYPDGLVGDEIPLPARIVKVADVFDAITSARVYKPAYTPEYAREVIEHYRGTVYDPLVVEALMRVFPQFVEICSGAAVTC